MSNDKESAKKVIDRYVGYFNNPRFGLNESGVSTDMTDSVFTGFQKNSRKLN